MYIVLVFFFLGSLRYFPHIDDMNLASKFQLRTPEVNTTKEFHQDHPRELSDGPSRTVYALVEKMVDYIA